jgi:hypothetical protein
MNYGLLINSSIGFGIFVVCAITSFKLLEQRKSTPVPAFASAIYWLALGFLYLFVSLRTYAAFFEIVDLDMFFQFAAHFAGGWMGPPVVFLLVYFLTENFKISTIFGMIIVLIYLYWIIIDISAGLIGPNVDYWASEWRPGSDLAKKISMYGLYLPVLVSAVGMNFLLFKVKNPMARLRIVATSVSILIPASVVIVDYFGPVGIMGRPLILLASLIGWMAYSPPSFLKKWFRV